MAANSDFHVERLVEDGLYAAVLKPLQYRSMLIVMFILAVVVT